MHWWMVLSLNKQPFVTTHFQFITAYFVRHCALKMPWGKKWYLPRFLYEYRGKCPDCPGEVGAYVSYVLRSDLITFSVNSAYPSYKTASRPIIAASGCAAKGGPWSSPKPISQIFTDNETIRPTRKVQNNSIYLTYYRPNDDRISLCTRKFDKRIFAVFYVQSASTLH